MNKLRMEATSDDSRATTLELFFDLVFVFALTQVTQLMADDLTGQGILRGILILGLLWWSWVGYAWLCNVVRADEGAIRLALLIAMMTMFVLALVLPEAFDDLPGGLHGPLVVALCYFLFHLMHIVLFWIIAQDDPELRRQLIRFAPSFLGATFFLVLASQQTGRTQTILWAAALVADYGGTYIGGSRGWRLRSAGHFAERHGLIIIIALGESIVALGVGAAEVPTSWPILAGSLAGLILAATLWWAYFDMSALQGEHALAQEPEATRPRLARDAYTFLHFPMIVGIVLLALGLKKVLEHVGDVDTHGLSDPLSGIGLFALYGGVALYLFGHVAFKWRIAHFFSIDRSVAAVALMALIPLGASIPALAALGLLTAVMVAVIAYETIHYAAHRAEVRHHIATSEIASSADRLGES